MLNYLNYIFLSTIGPGTISKLYTYAPFNHAKKRQYPGYVIAQGFMHIDEIVTTSDHDKYSKEEWLKYKINIFKKLCALLTRHGVDSFSATNCSATLHRMAKMLTSDLHEITMDSPQIEALFSQLYARAVEGRIDAQNISTSLWALARLIEAKKISVVNETHINALIASLHELREDAADQAIANSLWALAKLVDAGKLVKINVTHVNELLGGLHKNRALPERLTSSVLWAVARIVEAGKISEVNVTVVNSLLERIYALRNEVLPSVIFSALWAAGIVNTKGAVALPKGFAQYALTLAQQAGVSRQDKNQVIMAISLLKLGGSYNIKALIEDCRPVSLLKEKAIKAQLPSPKTPYKKEVFVCGFYVDVLCDGKQIIEFDGGCHDAQKQRDFDQFRDQILKDNGYKIKRVRPASAPKKGPEEKKQSVTVAKVTAHHKTDTHGFHSQKSVKTVSPSALTKATLLAARA